MRKPSSRQIIGKAGIPACIISNLTNIRYLSDLDITNGLILVTNRSMTLFTDGRYIETAKKHLNGRMAVKDLRELPRSMKRVQRCGFESDHVTVERLYRWKKLFRGTSFARMHDTVEYFRRSKDAAELWKMKQALGITETMLTRMRRILKPGVTEKECAWKLQQWAHELHADGMAFDSVVAFGEHTSRPHHKPVDRALKRGEMVLVDTGAKFGGYCADRTAMFFTGEMTAHQGKALEAVSEAKKAATKLVRKGASVHALDRAARDVLERYGMAEAFVHSLGHGVGLEIHEGVSLSQQGPDDRLLQHEVVTIEPGVYFPGKFGIRLEDMVFVQ